VGFCRDAKILAAVGMDDNHTIFLWDWAKGKILAEVKGQTAGVSTQPFNLSWF
jgi:microtubule-associated protein-like 6